MCRGLPEGDPHAAVSTLRGARHGVARRQSRLERGPPLWRDAAPLVRCFRKTADSFKLQGQEKHLMGALRLS
jgi:hypothetical protein